MIERSFNNASDQGNKHCRLPALSLGSTTVITQSSLPICKLSASASSSTLKFRQKMQSIVLPPLPISSLLDPQTIVAEDEELQSSSETGIPNSNNCGTDVSRDISTLRLDYLKSGGSNLQILDSLNALEAQAAEVSKSQGCNPPTVDSKNKNEDVSQIISHESNRSLHDVEGIQAPLYDENRGFSVFIDASTGIPYFGGTERIVIQMFIAVFDGSIPRYPVETVTANCNREAISFVGKALIKYSQRFFDVRPSNNIRLMFQFTILDGYSDSVADVKPVAWTTIDIFNDFTLNTGQWRLNMFYPPVNFKATSYNIYGSLPMIPNMYLYLRIANGTVHRLHSLLKIEELDFREYYKAYKPSYNQFELYQSVDIARKFIFFDDGEERSLTRAGSLLGSGSLRGSQPTVIVDSNVLGANQILYCK
ncbi:hypothetical protein BC830DRAFT_184685 [Chytriomyces sp. MP71]|nr:hypothetical protein BC830DRAFT_184685 [Chytriomyces sp. MP71]